MRRGNFVQRYRAGEPAWPAWEKAGGVGGPVHGRMVVVTAGGGDRRWLWKARRGPVCEEP